METCPRKDTCECFGFHVFSSLSSCITETNLKLFLVLPSTGLYYCSLYVSMESVNRSSWRRRRWKSGKTGTQQGKMTFPQYMWKELDYVLGNLGHIRYLWYSYHTIHKHSGWCLIPCRNCGDMHSDMVRYETYIFVWIYPQ